MKPEIVAVRTTCRVCGHGPLIPILSLGDLYVSSFIKQEDDDSENKKFPLDLILCDKSSGGCGLLQLKDTVSNEALYRQNWYMSGMNKTMTDELTGIAVKVESMVSLAPDDYVMDIGANDGTLLRGYTTEGLKRVGFEPAHNLMESARQGTTNIINNFFNLAEWQESYGSAKAKAITAIAMFYHVEDPNAFVAEVAECLHKEGIVIVQMMYLLPMIEDNVFDNVSHEHLEYYSLLTLENLFARHNLEICDAELNDINCGSLRVYARHKGGGTSIKLSPGATERLTSMRKREQEFGLYSREVYDDFGKRVLAARAELVDFIKKANDEGKKVYVYGASNKGNTLLQFCGLDHTMIIAAADRNPIKWGLKTVGTHIPIISEDQARKEKPDYFLVLPWGFMKEFIEREADFLKSGGKFIVPLTKLKIISS